MKPPAFLPGLHPIGAISSPGSSVSGGVVVIRATKALPGFLVVAEQGSRNLSRSFTQLCCSSPQIGLASFTSVPIVREEEKWRFAHDLGLGEEGRIQRQARKRMRAAAEWLASCQDPGNLFSYPTDYSRNVRSY